MSDETRIDLGRRDLAADRIPPSARLFIKRTVVRRT